MAEYPNTTPVNQTTKDNYGQFKSKYCTKKRITGEISIDIWIRQRNSLSITLLNVVVEGTFKATRIIRTIAQSSSKLIAYADDIGLIGRDKKWLEWLLVLK